MNKAKKTEYKREWWLTILKGQRMELKINPKHLANAANWHGVQAVKAYRRKDMDTYVRHVRIADQLWADLDDLTGVS